MWSWRIFGDVFASVCSVLVLGEIIIGTVATWRDKRGTGIAVLCGSIGGLLFVVTIITLAILVFGVKG